MFLDFKRFVKGILLEALSSDPTDNSEGSIWVNSSDNKLKSYLDSSVRAVVTEDQTQTLENKDIGDSNTINAQTDAFSIQDSTDPTKDLNFDISGATTNTTTTLDFNQTDNRTITFFDATDTIVGKTTTDELENKTLDFTAATGNNTISMDSADADYDNATSGLTATNTQDAIDELAEDIGTISDSAANKNLSNLESVAVNTDLLFGATGNDIGDQTNPADSLYIETVNIMTSTSLAGIIEVQNNVIGTNGLTVSTNSTSNNQPLSLQTRTALSSTTATGDLNILTGDHSASGNTGNIFIKTGDADTENSGDIIIESGTAGTTRGKLDIDVLEIDVNNVQIINVVDPTSDQHAATKKYVDDSLVISGAVPTGTVISSFATSTPLGYLYCDGTAVDRTTYSDLFTAIGTSCGQGDGSTTFNLPDLRARFLRGQDDGAGRDIDKNARTAQNTGGNEDDNVGSLQSDETAINNLSVASSGAHPHNAVRNVTKGLFASFNTGGVYGVDPDGSGGADYQPTTASGIVSSSGSNHTHTLDGGSETRPVNVYVRYYIKY